MKTWVRRLRGAVGMGLTWAAGWARIGAIIGVIVGSAVGLGPGALVTRWVGTLATLGFVGGGLFSSVLWVTERRRRFDELSIPRFTAWGAVGGLALGGLAVAIGLLGPGLSAIDIVIVGATTLLGAGSAAGTLALARGTARPALPAAEAATDVGLTEDEKRALLGSAPRA